MSRGSRVLELCGRYEHWRGRRIPLDGEELEAKYREMAESPQAFARGDLPCFMDHLARELPQLLEAPRVICAGDLQPEAFGTWRDRAGRLVWGIDLLDEVDLLPYPADLLRLATQLTLRASRGELGGDPEAICEALWSGWRERVELRRPRPFVLGPDHADLLDLHAPELRDPVNFGAEIAALAAYERALPKAAARMLAAASPEGGLRPELRRASLRGAARGARRIIAVAEVDGGPLVREIRQIPGPLSMWSAPRRVQIAGLAGAIDAARGVAAEPWRRQSRKWVVRGLDGSVSVTYLGPQLTDPLGLVAKLGAEAANLHLVPVPEAAAVKALRRDAEARGGDWLAPAAAAMAENTNTDHRELADALAAGPLGWSGGDAQDGEDPPRG
ncbi:MAG TPA: DUF2252 family protein [Solirubrobacteraceae bacterium]|nr:DUF2252 family protein [Solirubrobacteraceae bacterium]